MERILESFRECDGRHVFVLDTAPVLAFGDTAFLAERVDLVVLVVRAGQTPRSAAEDAMQRLKAERPLALVLNGQRGSILDAYYGYGENYGDYSPAGPK
jgi:Mrp family chromosome partitioning ATPase